MLIRLAGGRVIDPVNHRDEVGDVWIRDGRIVDAPEHEQPDESHDVGGKIVMAGAIDIHSHIAGGNVNTARMLLPEAHSKHRPRPAGTPLSTAGWSTFETGVIYAQMGFTTVIEPAIVPQNALHAHLELADIPIIDKGTLSVLGNDDFLLSLIRSGEGANAIADYVGSTLNAANAIGIKCINAGAATAFKYNVRAFSLDDVVPAYGMTSRQIVESLQQAVTTLKIRIRCIFIRTISAFPAMSRRHWRRSQPRAACRCTSHICNFIPMGRKATKAFLPLRRGSPKR